MKARWLIWLWPTLVFAQKPKAVKLPESADSLKMWLSTHAKDTVYVRALNEYAFLLMQQGEYDVAKKQVQTMERVVADTKFKPGYYKIWNMRGIIEYGQQHNEKAMEYFLEAEKVIRKYKLSDKLYQNSLNNIMIIYGNMGDRDQATAYAAKLIRFQESRHLDPLKSSPYAQMGSNLKFYGKPGEALTYYLKALEIEKKLGSDTGIAIEENDIGNIYDDLKQYKEAAAHFRTGLYHAQKANYKILETDLLINLSRMQRNFGQYRAAADNLLKAEAICKALNSWQPLKTVYQNLGNLYAKMNSPRAEQYYLLSVGIADSLSMPEQKYTINQTLSDWYHEHGNPAKAFQYLTAAQTYKDEAFKLETAKNTEQLLRQYEAGKREERIRSLSVENATKSQQIASARREKLLYLAGILLLVSVAALVYRQSRTRRKNNEKLQALNTELEEANKVKARFLGILNHDLKSPVSSLISFLRIQRENPEALDAETRGRMQEKTLTAAENLLGSMEDILLWSKGQMDYFKPEIKPVEMDWVFDDLRQHFAHVQHVKIAFAPNGQTIDTDEHVLKTILRNLVANAVNALTDQPNGSVEVTAHEREITVRDNGSGAHSVLIQDVLDSGDSAGAKSGLGLLLVRDLAKTIGCSILVTGGDGTTFTLKFQ